MKLIARLIAVAAAVIVPGVAAPASAKDELVIGITQYPSTLNPAIEAMMAKSYVLAMARRPLTTYDADWKSICMLCTELPSIENGLAEPVELGDGKRGVKLTYTLREDAKWGDGTPVSTDDILFSYEVGRHPMSGVGSGEIYRRISKIDVKDAKTFTFHVDKLTFDYAQMGAFDILPAHVERAAFAEPPLYRTRTVYDTAPTTPGLYNGPYRITETAPGSYIVLEPNQAWSGKKPAFRRIVVRAVENTAALEANLLSGGLDMIAGELGLSLDQAIAFEQRNADKFDIVYKPGLIYEHVELNLDSPVVADKRVRQALLWGIDRAAMSKQLFAGRQPVADTPVNPLDWIHTEELTRYGYDPAKAKKLLDEAGWSVMKGGIRHNQKGERLSFEFMTTAGNRSRELVQQVIQNQWRQIGVEAKIRNEPPRVLFGETVSRRNFTAALFAWISSPENVPRTTLHSTEIPSAANNWSGQNYPGFRNDEVDRLIDAIEIELDRPKRFELWKRLQQIFSEELPELPLFFRADAYILPKWLKGVRPTGHQFPTTLWVEDWGSE